MESGLLWRCV
jgi:hypothetical protein